MAVMANTMAMAARERTPERADRADVEAWLAAHTDEAERVQSWRAMAEMLHARYDSVVQEPVPAEVAQQVSAVVLGAGRPGARAYRRHLAAHGTGAGAGALRAASCWRSWSFSCW